jgi:hypothetical protein
MIWSLPLVAAAVTLASWFGVRSGAAPPIASVDTTMIAASFEAEIGDPRLRAMIGRFAETARAQNGTLP